LPNASATSTPNYYQNNPAGMQTNFGGTSAQAASKFSFKPSPQISPTLDLKTNGTEPWKYGLGTNPNANSLGVVPTDFSKKFPLPEGVSEPLPKDVGYKPQTPEELAKGVQNATPNDGGASAREAAGGSGITQFVNPYGDYSMADKFGFSGEYLQKKGFANKAAGALAGLSGVADAAAAFAGPMAAQRRQNQIMKGAAEDQRSNMTGEKRETPIGRRGGYFQDGDTFYEDEMGYESDLINKYPNSTRAKAEIAARNPVFGPKEMPEDYVYPEATTEASKPSASARDTWEQKTGMPWSKAKELGYTDGTAKDNTKLLSELNDPRFKKENLRKEAAKPTPRKVDKKATPTKTAKDFTYQDYQEAMKGKPKYSGKQGNIGMPNEGNMVTRLGERLANPVQAFGHYAKYGEMPAEGFSKNNKNAYDQVLGVANPFYWANALGNATDYTAEGEYKKAAIEALDAAPAAGKLLKFAPKAAALAASEGSTALANVGSKGVQAVNKVGTAVGPARRVVPLRNYFTPELAAGARNAQLGQGAVRLGQGAKRIGQGAPQTGQLSFGFGDGGFFQEGGMQPGMEEEQMMMEGSQEEQGGGDQMQAIAQEVASMLQQGADPQQILQQLVQAGVPEEQAAQIIQMVMGQMQGGQQEAPQGTPQLRKGGYYQEGGEAMDEQMEGENEGTEGETPNMEQIESQVEQALKQGADPQEILQQLVEMGIPEEQAVQMIQELLQEIQGGETEMEDSEEGQPMMKSGGEYLAALKGRTIKNYTYNKNTGNYDVEFE
jgi:hypothetical protein